MESRCRHSLNLPNVNVYCLVFNGGRVVSYGKKVSDGEQLWCVQTYYIK